MSKTCHSVSIHASNPSKGCRLTSIASRTSIHYYKHIPVGKYSYSYHYNVYCPFRSSPYGQFFTGHFILAYLYYVRYPSKVATSLCVLGLCSAFRSEEHTSELQSPDHLVCRLLLE